MGRAELSDGAVSLLTGTVCRFDGCDGEWVLAEVTLTSLSCLSVTISVWVRWTERVDLGCHTKLPYPQL
jgi:hypothetical protein